ncbi:hypothetical protein AA100600_2393 [Gluconobacter thailandicus F149-1 = NBRC 100600]|nr:hypothetical protein AA100600_2393 [Gluconobacter thailandicus F149-1 = NBRC 100600]
MSRQIIAETRSVRAIPDDLTILEANGVYCPGSPGRLRQTVTGPHGRFLVRNRDIDTLESGGGQTFQGSLKILGTRWQWDICAIDTMNTTPVIVQ